MSHAAVCPSATKAAIRSVGVTVAARMGSRHAGDRGFLAMFCAVLGSAENRARGRMQRTQSEDDHQHEHASPECRPESHASFLRSRVYCDIMSLSRKILISEHRAGTICPRFRVGEYVELCESQDPMLRPEAEDHLCRTLQYRNAYAYFPCHHLPRGPTCRPRKISRRAHYWIGNEKRPTRKVGWLQFECVPDSHGSWH